MNFLKKYQHTWIIPIYGIFYLWAFQYLEQRNVKPHIIHMKLDDLIPFCEYFIVPYFLWFAYIAVTVIYFSFINKSKQEYYHLVFSLAVGMTTFLVVSYFYPTGFKTSSGRKQCFHSTGPVPVSHRYTYQHSSQHSRI